MKKFQNIKIICISLLITICVIILGFVFCPKGEKDNNPQHGANKNSTKSSQKVAAKMEYEDFSNDDMVFIKSNIADFFETISKKKSGIYYFGYAECPWCEELVPILSDIAKESNININYIESKDKKNKDTISEKDMSKFISIMQNYLAKDADGNELLFVPYLVNIVNGNIVATHLGTVSTHDAYERTLNKEEDTALNEELKKLINFAE